MTRYEELKAAYARSSERDGVRLDRLGETMRVETANILRATIEHVREHLGRRGDADVVYFEDPETGAPCPEDSVWGHLIPEMVPCDGNGYHVSLVLMVEGPDHGRRRRADTRLRFQLEVIPFGAGRWTLAFEGRPAHPATTVSASDPKTLTAFAQEVFEAVREYFDTYALPPERAVARNTRVCPTHRAAVAVVKWCWWWCFGLQWKTAGLATGRFVCGR